MRLKCQSLERHTAIHSYDAWRLLTQIQTKQAIGRSLKRSGKVSDFTLNVTLSQQWSMNELPEHDACEARKKGKQQKFWFKQNRPCCTTQGGFAHGTFEARCLHGVAHSGDISFDVVRVHRARGVFLECSETLASILPTFSNPLGSMRSEYQ